MNTLKEENELRISKAYDLSKFALRNKPRDKKVTEVFEEVARELGYMNPGRVANIYYESRKKDPDPVGKFKVKKKINIPSYEN